MSETAKEDRRSQTAHTPRSFAEVDRLSQCFAHASRPLRARLASGKELRRLIPANLHLISSVSTRLRIKDANRHLFSSICPILGLCVEFTCTFACISSHVTSRLKTHAQLQVFRSAIHPDMKTAILLIGRRMAICCFRKAASRFDANPEPQIKIRSTAAAFILNIGSDWTRTRDNAPSS